MGTSPKEVGSGKEEGIGHPIWDCGSLLYDSHELVSIVHAIERHMMLWPNHGDSKPIVAQYYDPEEVTSIQNVSKGSSSIVTSSSEIFMKSMWQRKFTRQGVKKKNKKTKSRFSKLVCGENLFQSFNGL
uniref:Uncharacterized protein LOC101510241 n=1 Tax=Cicer arietinum TaxID=3827 RepID=A0A1S2XV70_CICAR|nr:uncharacterized protein LOC101510241 [Cicer arietinum]